MKILKLLGAKKSEVNAKAQERIGRQLKRGQEKLIDDLDAKRDALLAKRDALESITVDTAQNQLDTWNTDYHKVIVDLALLDKEIEIANSTLKDMFDEKTK